jgi:hypothetical protein
MPDTPTPGSEGLLPVAFKAYMGPPSGTGNRHAWLTMYNGRVLQAYAPEIHTLIPASRLADLEAEVARLRAGLTAIQDDTYPRSHQLNGQCNHGQYIHEQCEECIWDYAHSILNPKD